MPGLPADERKKVLWIGPEPQESQISEFEHRQLTLSRNVANPAQAFPFARAIIFKFNPLKPGRIVNDIRAYALRAADHGLGVITISDNAFGQNVISEVLSKIKPQFKPIRMTAPSEPSVAESAARCNPGPGESPELQITVKGNKNLSPTEILLFKRAFYNCESIEINPLKGGRSANVFSVHAAFSNLPVSPRPLPFFAKIDRRNKIEGEIKTYREYTELYIPFSSRPNLIHAYCVMASTKGMIVGNFVEHSESLLDSAMRGHARTAIFSLFEETLRGWKIQAYRKPGEDIIGNLYTRLCCPFNPAKMREKRIATALALGATLRPQESANLAKNMPERGYRSAPIHGDMHAMNVRVRGTDAILIDFNSTRIGPILADPASLEVSLAFAVGNLEDDNDTWRTLIDRIFHKDYLMHAPPPADRPLPREWMWNSIRQIRLFALSMEMAPFQYAEVLGIYLLRHAMYPVDNHDGREEYRRAYAYVLGERLLLMARDAYQNNNGK